MHSPEPPAPPLERKVALLRDPRTYPEHPARIETVETHMSWVFLTETRVYKLKKPVRYDYLDYSTLERRAFYCAEEVRLNRAMAPGVYLGVVPLALDADGIARLGGTGTVVEWLVTMRRLPAERMLDRVIAAGALDPREIDGVGERLAAFYREAPRLPQTGAAYRARYRRRIAQDRRVLAHAAYGLPPELVDEVHDWLARTLERAADDFDARAPHRVEGHGDLRPEHVCLESPPLIFDRLEFSRALRTLDPVEELCFLGMECARLHAPWVQQRLLDVYERATGDRAPAVIRRFYTVHRACVRARLAALHTADVDAAHWPKWLARAREYLDWARRAIENA